MESRRGTPTATAFAKNLPTGAGFNGRSVYDGVFGVQRKGGRSLMEDYGEIFGGSGGSIPVLDVPELNESKMKVDVRSSQLDYSKVFGGFAEFDFAVSLEELIANPKSEKKASTKTRSISENLIHSNLQEENEVHHQSFDGVKKVKMSFNKTNPGSGNGATGTVHVAKLHEVPGYSYVIDELNRDDKPKPVSPASREIRPTMNFSDGMKEGRHTRRTMSDLPPGYDYKQSSNGDHGSRNISSSKTSPQNGVFSSPREVGLGKRNSPEVLRASRLPNNSDGDSKCDSSEFGAFMNRCSGDAADLSSSPNLDGEVDENSDAATSAAAVKKAIEEAQSRINMAIELMERKKEGQMKPTFGGLKVKKKMKNKGTAEEKKFRGKEARDMDDQFHVSSPIKKDTMEPTQVAPDMVETTVIVNEDAGETHEENFRSFQTDHRDTIEESISATQEEEEEVKIVMQPMDECKPEEKESDENQVEYSTEVEATEESSKDVSSGEQDRVSGLPDVPESRDELKSDEEVRGEKQDNKTKQIFSRWWGKIEEMLGVSTDLEASGGKPNKLEEPTDSRQGFEVEEQKEDNSSERSEDSKKCEDNEEIQTEVLNREGCPESNDLPETEENRTVTEDIPKQEECGKEYEEASEMVKLEEEQKESCREGENDEKRDVCSGDYVEKPSDEFVEMETDEEELNEFHYWEENRKKHEDDGESGGNEGEGENVVDEANEIKEAEEIQEGISGQENTERIQEHANQSVEGEKSGDAEEIQRGNSEWVDSETIEQQTDQCSYSETTEDTEEDLNCLGDVDDSAENAHQQVEVENLVESREPCRHEHLEDVEMLPKLVVHRENVVIEELTEECVVVRQSGRGSEAVEEMLPKLVVHRENVVIKELAEECVEVGQYGRESEAVEVNNFAEYAEVFGASGLAEGISELDEIQKQMESERDALPIDRNGINVDVKDMRFEQLQQNQPEKESEMFCNAETHIEESTCELEEDIPDFEEVKVTKDQENKCSPESRDGVRLLDNWVGTQTDLPPCTFDGEEETAGIAPKEAITNQGTEGYEENHYETLTKIRKKSKAISQKKMDLKQEEQRKRDEAKQRERERRKERIAVERAVREARERAFADACERAEKAAAEKANVEARRRARWEKPSADANDKASMEAKLKAERAAVERATAEARQRALEKTFSEKASFKDSHLNASDLPASSRFTSSSNNGVTHVSERVDGEPAQRGKAISEREQRTEERAAKALAEKNMRDLLAQKEQAERNRLAETLDAEVKRWSKGKEGNLRALLSTLQYILGPESGWQPIPLTELIATTAVKKAYRKATLYVHPDKLQQRGASIQQKYTCEKVFDLLKAAWNRFSAEER